MTAAKWTSLALRWVVEAGIVLGLVVWGIETGDSLGVKVLLAILAPAVVFGFWGFVDFHWAGRPAEAIRLTQELAITALVAAALITAGAPLLGWLLAAVSVAHHIPLYATGDRLIKNKT